MSNEKDILRRKIKKLVMKLEKMKQTGVEATRISEVQNKIYALASQYGSLIRD